MSSEMFFAPPRLLVVEDDQEQQIIFRAVLEEEGYHTTSASSLPAALAALEEHLFHLVLTDLFHGPGQLPLQSIQPLLVQATPTPVGIVTAWPVPAEEAIQAGAAFLLRKPFELDDLLRTLDTQIHPEGSLAHQQQQVMQFFATLNDGDWKALARFCTPDVRVVSLPAPAVQVSGTSSGLLSLRATLEKRSRSLPGYAIDEVRVYAHPTGVSARFKAHWQRRDGHLHRVAGSVWFRFQGERISQIEGTF